MKSETWYVYIFNTRAKILHCGFCKDIEKALAFYNDMPTLSLDADFKLFKLVYLIDAPNKQVAEKHFLELSKMAKKDLIKVVKQYNPEVVEWAIGVNIHL